MPGSVSVKVFLPNAAPIPQPFGFPNGGSHDLTDLKCIRMCLKRYKVAEVEFSVVRQFLLYDYLIYHVVKGDGVSKLDHRTLLNI